MTSYRTLLASQAAQCNLVVVFVKKALAWRRTVVYGIAAELMLAARVIAAPLLLPTLLGR
jgi:hypothetical protein